MNEPETEWDLTPEETHGNGVTCSAAELDWFYAHGSEPDITEYQPEPTDDEIPTLP